MIRKLLFLSLFLGVAGTLFSAALPFSEEMNKPERYQKNSSGKLTIKIDPATQALHFVFSGKKNEKDQWIYPLFVLKDGENLKSARTLSFDIKIDQGAASQALIILFPGDIHIPYTIPQRDWNHIEIDLTKIKTDLAQIKKIAIGLNTREANLEFSLKNVSLDNGLSQPMAAEGVQMSNDVGGAYFADRIPTFSLKPAFTSARGYTLRNSRGTVLQQGNWPEGGKGALCFPGLSRGYYMLTVDGLDDCRGFAIVPDPATRNVNPDSFFALGAISAWGSRRAEHSKNKLWPQDAPERCAELIRIAGIPLVREFNQWPANQRSAQEFTPLEFVDHTAKLLQDRNIKMASYFEGAPGFMRRERPGFFPRFPDDLVGTFDFMKKFAIHQRGRIDTLEYFNEPDIGSWPEPVWDFAAAAKAASLGFRAGNPDAKILNGSFAEPPPSLYAQSVLDNELQEYIDIFNIHSYAAPGKMEAQANNCFSFLEKNKLGDIPVYLTEIGHDLEGPGLKNNWIPGKKEHSIRQAMLCAEVLPKQYVTLQERGINKVFYFCMIPKNERNDTKAWGLLGYDFTIKPAFVALTTLTAEFGNAQMLGKLDLGPEIHAYLYAQPDGTQSLAFWSRSEVDLAKEPLPETVQKELHRQTATISVPDGTYPCVDFLGTPSELTAVNRKLTLNATRFPQYVHGLTNLKPTTQARKMNPQRKHTTDKDLTVILKTRLSEQFQLAPEKTFFDLLTDKPVPFELEVHNLDTVEKTGSIHCSGSKIIGLPETVTIPPRSWIKLDLQLLPPEQEQSTITFSGTFNKKPITNLAMNCKRTKFWKRKPLEGTRQAKNWTASSGGTMTITDDSAENAVRFQASIPNPESRWIYPVYQLKLPQESLANAYAIEFEIKFADDMPPPRLALMQLSDNGYLHHLNYGWKKGQWQTSQIRINGVRSIESAMKIIHPESIDKLMIGVNPGSENTTFWVRNLQLVYAPQGKD